MSNGLKQNPSNCPVCDKVLNKYHWARHMKEVHGWHYEKVMNPLTNSYDDVLVPNEETN